LPTHTGAGIRAAYPEEEFAIRSLKLGASGYLNKSLGSDEMLAAAEKVRWPAARRYVIARSEACRLKSCAAHSFVRRLVPRSPPRP